MKVAGEDLGKLRYRQKYEEVVEELSQLGKAKQDNNYRRIAAYTGYNEFYINLRKTFNEAFPLI